MKKYLTTSYSAGIVGVEILRETGSFVYIPANYGKKKEKREIKVSGYHQYHDTWAQAHKYLLKQALERVARAERQFYYETKVLRKIEAMEEDNGN